MVIWCHGITGLAWLTCYSVVYYWRHLLFNGSIRHLSLAILKVKESQSCHSKLSILSITFQILQGLRRWKWAFVPILTRFSLKPSLWESIPKTCSQENITNAGKISKKKKHTLHSAPCFSKPLSSRSHTHKHIGTNTYTSKQRCHFTQEGSAVLSIRQGLVLGQRLLPNLRPPSPGSTGPLWPPPPRRQAPHCSCTTNKWQFSCSDKL